ncbi:MAG: lysophospholipid acyltransferase family protein [Bacteroidales bacterium]|nr:lysophospholipid acyltransferase family protein [Bacteroidales bacterium]
MAKRGKIGSFILKIFLRPLGCLPLGFHRACGRCIGRFLGKTVAYRRDVVMINLSRSFPDKKYKELQQICNKFYERLVTIFMEAIWFGSSSNKRLDKSHIAELNGIEPLNEFYRQGKSVFVLSSHMGNWEIIGGIKHYAYSSPLSCPENDVCVVYKKQSSAMMNEFLKDNRIAAVKDKEHFDGMVETKSVMRYAVKNRNISKLYTFIGDQYPYGGAARVEIESFLGQRTPSMIGAASLACRMSLPLVYQNMLVREDGNYDINYTVIADDASKFTPEELMTRYYQLLEEDLKKQPWNYLWSHKRWK